MSDSNYCRSKTSLTEGIGIISIRRGNYRPGVSGYLRATFVASATYHQSYPKSE